MGPKLYNAVRLYVDGIRDGHLAAALDKYVASDLVQHTPGIAPGRDGLATALQPLVDRHQRRTVTPLRGFEDGSRVFLHTFTCYGLRAMELVTMDIFDTDDDDQIIEHWSASAPLRTPSRSGASPVDGPRIATDASLTEQNKRLVRAHVSGGFTDAGTVIEHGERDSGHTGIDQIIGYGSFVATFGTHAAGGCAYAVADLLRVEPSVGGWGRIAEHWDVRMPMEHG